MTNLRTILSRNIDSGTMSRGQIYFHQGRVKKWKWLERNETSGAIESSVVGSGSVNYTQTITINFVTQRLNGVCTCPVGINCKHVAAAVLEAGIHEAAVKLAPASTSAVRAEIAKPLKTTTPKVRPVTNAAEVKLAPDIEVWIASLTRATSTDTQEYPAGINERVVYVLLSIMHGNTPTIVLDIYKARVLKSGVYSGLVHYTSISNAVVTRPQFVSVADARIFRQILAGQRFSYYGGRHHLIGLDASLIADMVATKRAFWHPPEPTLPQLDPAAALTWREPREGVAAWKTLANGDQFLQFATTPPATHILPTSPPVYVDMGMDKGQARCGIVETTMSPAITNAIASAPILPKSMVPRVARELQLRQLHHVVSAPTTMPETVLNDFAPTPVLTINTHKEQSLDNRTWRYTSKQTDYAQIVFDYRGEKVSGKNPPEIVRIENDTILRIARNMPVEKAALSELKRLGFLSADHVYPGGINKKLKNALVFAGAENDTEAMPRWLAFLEHTVPLLRQSGWQVNVPSNFRFNLTAIDDWYADVEESKTNWFDFEIGVEVDGKKMSLIPILVKLIRESPHEWRMAELNNRNDDEKIVVEIQPRVRVALPLGRIKPILNALYELYMRDSIGATGNSVRLSTFDAARLAEVDAALQLRWVGGERLLAMGKRLASFDGIAPVTIPKNFTATLRPYQLEGVAWLQFLREYQLAGVLADDMGLGKTVQTLAHILIEKTAGRMSQPILVVAPTSLMNTWASEAKRFTPSLKILVSHGSDRDRDSTLFAKHDVVLTTYALLNRDEKLLKDQKWHSVILDEAQNIKNPKTKAAQVASTLNADNRLCLSGTPLENHLGELWSLFSFLMPGFLGDDKHFQREFRKPIEKEGMLEPRQFLARRIKPFMLRRTKELVASELPAKTIVTRTIALNAEQADLYETVRAAMDERVRALIAEQGLARSHIEVLDALLKLRQICCDPRLLPATFALKKSKPAPSAKLELLLEMLEELIAEGRSILVFSQFTSMLALIEEALNERKITYVKLTGQTKDRKTPVDTFQSGKVKLFLISLKAGGTGLTLTAADTVIHYDPWWNPAVENQATDRAHRIGQDKPVFVYKLVSEGTVEERIVEMQTRKGALAAGILEGDGKAVAAMTAADLQGLFQPLSG
jgi:superfamily II DNA or RNA helicase